MGLIAKADGVDPSKVKYVAHSGGGEAKAAILSGGVTAGVSGVSEFAEDVEAGKMRALALGGTFAIRSPTGWAVSGPRFFPLVIAIGLIACALAFLATTTVRPSST